MPRADLTAVLRPLLPREAAPGTEELALRHALRSMDYTVPGFSSAADVEIHSPMPRRKSESIESADEQLVIFAKHPISDDSKGVLAMSKMGGFILGVAMLVPVVGCGPRREVRVDTWGPGETTYYSRWEVDTHRHHIDWDQRNEHDRKAYWKWRHSHHD